MVFQKIVDGVAKAGISGKMSITEVAKASGCSPSTVSRVINEQPGISDETAQRVREAMASVGYTPPPRSKRRGPKPKRVADSQVAGDDQGGVAVLERPDVTPDTECEAAESAIGEDSLHSAADYRAAAVAAPEPASSGWPGPAPRPRGIDFRKAALVLCGLVLGAALVGLFTGRITVGGATPPGDARDSDASESARSLSSNESLSASQLSSPPVLEQAVECEWQGADGPLVAGRGLPSGSLTLTHGAAALRYVNGARLILEAPVRFDVSSPVGCFLWSGRVTVHVPNGAAEFVVNTPAAIVGVSGASDSEVGLQAEDVGATEVHVLSGRVDVQPRKNNPENRLVRRLQSGAAERYETFNRPGWQVIELAADGFLGTVSDYASGDSGSFAAAVLADNPVAYWRLSESSGTRVNDAASFGIQGTYRGALALCQPAAMLRESDPSVFFQGGWVSIDRREELQFDSTDAFSLEAWVRTPVAGIDMRPIGKIGERGQGGCPGYSMFIRDDVLVFQATNRFHVKHNQGVLDGDVLDVPGTTPICDGRWHHLVTTYDGSMKAAGVALYVDGRPEAFDVSHPLYADMLTGSIRTDDSQLELARGGGQFKTNHFMGSLDDVAVYDFVLSEAQVKRHFDAALGTGR